MDIFESGNGVVTKFVFDFDGGIAEAILYQYKDRVVICCSTQSGCKVGCKFCGTGERFIKNLTHTEIYHQITAILQDRKMIKVINKDVRFQIMFMSMGEPMHNWDNVSEAIKNLHCVFPNAELLISTVGIRDDITKFKMIELSKQIKKIGLQFSIHKSSNVERAKLIPHKDVMGLWEIRDFGIRWSLETGRPVYLNYCVDGTNNKFENFVDLHNIFSKSCFNFTFSVICSKDETMKDAGYKNIEKIRLFEDYFIKDGYNTRVFNPEGQDDIGGGCGQLWYFQNAIK